MDAGRTKQRAFILSSFRRLNIPFSKKVYDFADFIIEKGWMPPLGSLTEVDKSIQEEYSKFIKFD